MANLKIENYAIELENGEGFYSLKFEHASGWTPWEKVTPAELAVISNIVTSSNAFYDPSRKVFKSTTFPSQRQRLVDTSTADIPSRE